MPELIGIVYSILRLAVQFYVFALWGRFIADWVRVAAPQWSPRGAAVIIIELIYTVTDPPIKFFRKVIPSIRIGPISLDFSWFLCLVCCWILLGIIPFGVFF